MTHIELSLKLQFLWEVGEIMRILYLEDDITERDRIINWIKSIYKDNICIDVVDNLISFDEIIYDIGEQYDKYIIDLGIDRFPELTDEQYKTFWESKTNDPEFELQLYQGIPMEGLDYYRKVMYKSGLAQSCPEDILLLSGYVDIVMNLNLVELKEVTIVSKGSEVWELDLRCFLES